MKSLPPCRRRRCGVAKRPGSAIMNSVLNVTRPSPAVFLDRDGTLMTDVEYCADPARVAVFPACLRGVGATAGCRLSARADQQPERHRPRLLQRGRLPAGASRNGAATRERRPFGWRVPLSRTARARHRPPQTRSRHDPGSRGATGPRSRTILDRRRQPRRHGSRLPGGPGGNRVCPDGESPRGEARLPTRMPWWPTCRRRRIGFYKEELNKWARSSASSPRAGVPPVSRASPCTRSRASQ